MASVGKSSHSRFNGVNWIFTHFGIVKNIENPENPENPEIFKKITKFLKLVQNPPNSYYYSRGPRARLGLICHTAV
eukprot:SAG22_NODE_6802_length_809_cov_1.939437_1_plen_76_part_00